MTDRTAPSSDARKRNAERDMPDAHETARARDAGCATHFTVHADGWITNNMTGERFQPRTRTHAINPDTGEFTPIQEPDMTAKTRHDELVALLTEIRDRLPEPEGVNAVEDGPTCITEEPPVGTYLVDGDDDVWVRREGGWVDWAPESRTWGHVFEFEEVRTRYAPLRLATPADLARAGIDEPAPADDLPGEPVEPGDLRAGDRIAFTYKQQRITCNLVSSPAGRLLRSDVPNSNGYRPSVAYGGGGWCAGISDVRLIERAPREDEDPDEALAKVAFGEYMLSPSWDKAEPDMRKAWLDVARAVREHIEAEQEDAVAFLREEVESLTARAEKAEGVCAILEDRVKFWQEEKRLDNDAELSYLARAKKAEDERGAQAARATKAEAERDALRERLDALRADVESQGAVSASRQVIIVLGDILTRDDERAKGERR